ncbi:aminotransferase class V-fold PLP-dependent enzyme [Flammeovirga sp. MY04]|uniref:aminotransferase class V-fold PLP-dependent enzyme n=1 Tax=Flammeovirga sp. MY04 TaxID=1191459 RepID=UPI00080641EA|nr:aminotransferase class V-fold PLP-dependent enzyme [Flammeovirga sp. MY04]ANQ48864.1 aminotransferase class V-fold PLP-dependent enzyme [Flammeovirga sp. MY04]
MKKFHLTAGPSELYFTVEQHIQQALKENVAVISHRSKAFQDMFGFTASQVREMLNVPEDYYMVFTGSATEVWERLAQNCISKKSTHFVNGSFSTRFHQFAEAWGHQTQKIEKPLGEGFNADDFSIDADSDFISITQNETSTGVQFPLEDIYKIREENPDKLIAIDAVSSIPFVDIDLTKVDSLYFSVQKGMGMPAGLGIWLFNERCLERAKEIKASGRHLGGYHDMFTLLKNAEKNMTPATPNALGIYLLGKVSEDLLRRKMDIVRSETEYKAGILYAAVGAHKDLDYAVKEERVRSKTVIVIEILNGRSPKDFMAYLEEKGLVVSTGYGPNKATQVRIANFPTHSKELYFQLIDLINAW